MARCNVDSLLAQANCFTCLPGGYFLPIRLALYSAILAEKGVTLSVDELISRAKCFVCLPSGQQSILKLVLMCQIIGGNVLYFSDLPAPPTNEFDPVIIT